jgi:hypothetical protein
VILRKLLWPALLFLLCAGFFWKLVLTDQYTWLDDPDIAYLAVPRIQFQASEWHHLRFPLWDPYTWFGQPFLGQFTGAAFPLNWPLYLQGFDAGKVRLISLHWYYVLMHFVAALAGYWLCRDLRRSRPASLFAALVFALGGFTGNAILPELVNGIAFAPVVLLFELRALRGRRPVASAALSGFFLGLCWLSGHHEIPLYVTTVAALLWIAGVARRPFDWRRLRLPLAAALVTVLISGFQTAPGREYGKLAKRWVNLPDPIGWQQKVPYSVHGMFSTAPASVLGIVTPGYFTHVTPFIGVTAFSLALVGIAAGWRRQKPVRLFAVIAAGGFLYSLGASDVFHGMIYALAPQFDKARAPARALALFSLGIAPLTAYGVDAVRRQRARAVVRRLAIGLWGSGIGVFALVAGTFYWKGFDARDPLVLAGIAALLAAAVMTGWRAGLVKPGALAAALVALMLFEMGNVTGANFASRIDPKRPGHFDRLSRHDDIAKFLRWRPEPVRVWVDEAEIPYNFGAWHSIDTAHSYVPGITANIVDLETHTDRKLDLMAVNFAIGREPRRPRQELAFRGPGGLNVYHNPGAFPRAWVVHEAVRVDSMARVREAIEDPGWDLRAKAPVTFAPPSLEACSGDDVSIKDRKASRVVLEAKLNCRGMVVLADTAFPGWQVTVDGRPAEALEPYGALRGVVAGPGTHRIEWRYLPASVLVGAAMSALGLLLTGVLLSVERRRVR